VISGGRNDIGIGDIVLVTKWLAFSEQKNRPAVALRLALKLPTGDPRLAFGSGEADLGLGIAAQKGFGRRWVLYGNANGIFPGGDFLTSGLTLDPFFSGLLALEFRVTPRFSLLVQFEYFTSPFHGVDAPILEDAVGEITAGFSYLFGERLLWQLGATENFTAPFPDESAADFTFFTTLGYQF
jgi:hypothetical protein